MNIICTKNGTLLEKYHIDEMPWIQGSISTSIGINPPRGTALVWDAKLKKNVWQEDGFPTWEDGRELLHPAMLEYAEKSKNNP